MSDLFRDILVLIMMMILVVLFAWIYRRERRHETGLWLLGWSFICIHFLSPVVSSLFPSVWPASSKFKFWVEVTTLEVAGTAFFLSVSEVFRELRERTLFLIFIFGGSVAFVTAMVLGASSPWIFVAILLASTISGLFQGIRFYGFRRWYLYSMATMLLPYAIFTMWKAAQGKLDHGIDFYLFGFYMMSGQSYYRRYRQLSPGVVFTWASFAAWGLVFPLSTFLLSRHVGPASDAFVWDLPKFLVAFGMILTLFERQTQAASAAAAQYQALFEGNLAAVYVSTFDGALINCNRAFLKMYGFNSKPEALATPLAESYTDPSTRNEFLKALEEHGHVLDYECSQRRRDGALFWTLKSATLVTSDDGRRLIEGTAIDITERKQAEIALKQSEERFATIFRESPIACGIIGLDGVFLDVNETMLRIMGLSSEHVVGKTGVELGLWKSQEQRERFYQQLRAEGSVHNLPVEFNDARGRRHAGIYFGTLVRIGDRQCIFAMMLDQTEERELEAKFLQSQKMEALGRLAGGVAHDFNNLLGVIGGYAELLESKLGHNEGLRRYCSKIIDTKERASGLTRQLLTFSRKEITRPTALQPTKALEEISGLLPRLIGEEVELGLRLNATGTVLMDKTHFEQIVFNIAINASDAMPNGGQLTIETEDIFRPMLLPSGSISINQFVAIRMTDTGVGMDETTRQHAFEPFFTTKGVGRGTGLGLATVYGIVQECSGEISIDSKPGKGTQVTIFVPAAASMESEVRDNAGQEIKRGAGTILLVEDEAELRNMSAEFLSAIGYSVICASSGHEALKLARETGSIDLVISDVVMPKMNGREFADCLLRARPEVKLLFVSGYADDVVLHTGLPVDARPFLQKPFSLRQLGSKVQELLSVSAKT